MTGNDLHAFAEGIPDRDAVSRVLGHYSIAAMSWGKGGAKTLDHLAAEIRDGDSELFIDGDSLARRVRNVWVDVFVVSGTGRHHLVERRQVFYDGRTRERNLPASIGEKCKIQEDPAAAAQRGLAEELGIEKPLSLVQAESRENPVGEPSYPGLRTVYDTYWFIAEIDPKDYKPEGYVEEQPDKRTYFEWE